MQIQSCRHRPRPSKKPQTNFGRMSEIGIVAMIVLLSNTICLAQDVKVTTAARPQSSHRPNVLLIAIDDLASCLGCYGNLVVKTPHLDALASKGVRFEHAYCQLPLCNPSRASVLTGMRPDQLRVYDLDRHFREEIESVVTLPQLFRQNQYSVARVGKLYHYNVPAGIGTNGLDDPVSWDTVINPSGRDVTDAAFITNPTPEKAISAALSWLQADGADEEQTDGMIAGEAIQWMSQHVEQQMAGPTQSTDAQSTDAQSTDAQSSGDKAARPFFLGVGFFRPHTPYVAPKKYFDLYQLESIQVPLHVAGDRDDIPLAALAHNCRVANYGLPIETCRQALQAYYACVSFVDAQVGRLLAALDALNQADNTIVVVWSDHGYHLGEHNGIWQKRTLFEESARSPLIIFAPDSVLTKVPAKQQQSAEAGVSISRSVSGRTRSGNGTACQRIVEFIDIMPTIAELSGLQLPSSASGRSLVPLLRDPKQTWDHPAFTQVLRPGVSDAEPARQVMGRSIRTNRWRYTEWNEGQDGVELYDHWNDPHELKNLAASSDLKNLVSGLRKQFAGKAQGLPPQTPVNPARL